MKRYTQEKWGRHCCRPHSHRRVDLLKEMLDAWRCHRRPKSAGTIARRSRRCRSCRAIPAQVTRTSPEGQRHDRDRLPSDASSGSAISLSRLHRHRNVIRPFRRVIHRGFTVSGPCFAPKRSTWSFTPPRGCLPSRQSWRMSRSSGPAGDPSRTIRLP